MKSCFTVFCILMLFAASTLPAQINWTKDANNPILSGGAAGTWNRHVFMPSVLYNPDSLRYEMWFGASAGPGTPEWRPFRIGFATSDNGINWTMHPSAVLSPDPGTWDETTVEAPMVIRENGTYKMWYTGWSSSNEPGGIGYATSPNGIDWTKYPSIVLEPGTAAWEAGYPYGSFVMPVAGGYKMWYSAVSDINSLEFNIGYATSVDGITWQRHPNNPVLTVGDAGRWDDELVGWPHVNYIEGTYYMWYNSKKTSPRIRQVGLATSTDGINWTKYNDPTTSSALYVDSDPVLVPTPGQWDGTYVESGSVLFMDNTFHMWYSGSLYPDASNLWRIGHATAPVIINVPDDFTTIQGAIDAASDGNIVLVDEGTYYENINFKGKAITVASRFYMDEDTSHISKTIIDGSQNSNPDSGSVVYLVSGEDTTSVLMGFTITNGSGTKGQYTYEGVKYDSRDGGGIICWNSGGRFVSNKIISNTISSDTEAFGGGVAAGDFGSNAWVILEKNHIVNNTVSGLNGAFGGGVGLTCNGRLFDNIISYNSCYATEDGGAGGGVDISTESSKPRTVFIEDNHINHNFVQGKGTQPTYYWSALGGGIYNAYCKILVLENEIGNNKLTDLGTGNGSGGGIYTWKAGGGSVISRNTISNNLNGVTGTKYGGGISLASNDVPVYNNIITGNSASHGGGIYCTYDDPEIINNTIVNNTASTSGGGLYSANSNPVVLNTILWDNEAPSGPQISGSFIVRYSDIQGGIEGEGNIDINPFFADSLFNLSDTSYCVGNGIDSVEVNSTWYKCPSTDFYGNKRPDLIVDEFVDMGAIESPYERVIIDKIAASEIKFPLTFKLSQNHPNPFNPTTIINYQLPMTNDVELTIYNLLGQKVVTLVLEKQKAGYHQVEWNASGFASGVYYYRLSTEAGFVQTKKLVLLR